MSNDLFSTSMRQSIQRKIDTLVASVHEAWLASDEPDTTLRAEYRSQDTENGQYFFTMTARVTAQNITFIYGLYRGDNNDSVSSGQFVLEKDPWLKGPGLSLKDQSSSHYITRYTSSHKGSVRYSQRSVYSELSEGGPQSTQEREWNSQGLEKASMVKSLDGFHQAIALRLMSQAQDYTWVRSMNTDILDFIEDPIGHIDFLRTLESKAFNLGRGVNRTTVSFTLPETFPASYLRQTNLDVDFYQTYLQPLLESGDYDELSEDEFVDLFAARYFESAIDECRDEIITSALKKYKETLWQYMHYKLDLPMDQREPFTEATEKALTHHLSSILDLDVLWDGFCEQLVRKAWARGDGPVGKTAFGVRYV